MSDYQLVRDNVTGLYNQIPIQKEILNEECTDDCSGNAEEEKEEGCKEDGTAAGSDDTQNVPDGHHEAAKVKKPQPKKKVKKPVKRAVAPKPAPVAPPVRIVDVSAFLPQEL